MSNEFFVIPARLVKYVGKSKPKPVYGKSLLRRTYNWPKHFEVTYRFEVRS